MQNVLIHYSVKHDYVGIRTFVQAAVAAERSVNAINTLYFSGEIEFELVILPPREGSLKQYIGVIAKGVSGISLTLLTVIQFLDSPAVQEISRELYGETPTEALIDQIKSLETKVENKEIDEIEAEEEARTIIEEMASKTASSALEQSRDQLERLKAPDNFKYEMQKAQSELFETALEDKNVVAIGFSEGDEFPIPRNEFAQRAIRPKKPEEPKPDQEWKASLVNIRVTSPNFEREDRRLWKGREENGGTILFRIIDDHFWSMIANRELQFSEHTEMKVQLGKLYVDGASKSNVVVRVLQVNQVKLGDPLPQDALEALLENVRDNAADSSENLLRFFSGDHS